MKGAIRWQHNRVFVASGGLEAIRLGVQTHSNAKIASLHQVTPHHKRGLEAHTPVIDQSNFANLLTTSDIQWMIQSKIVLSSAAIKLVDDALGHC